MADRFTSLGQRNTVDEVRLYFGSAGAARLDVLPLEAAAPGSGVLGDYDGDGRPGLAINKGGSFLDPDEKERQWWDLPLPAGWVMDRATVDLTFWGRIKDGDNVKRGIVNVGLYDCATGGTGCVGVGSGSLDKDPWGTGSGFLEATISLGEVTHTWAPGRVLRLAVFVGNEAGGDMDFAFDMADYPSALLQRFP